MSAGSFIRSSLCVACAAAVSAAGVNAGDGAHPSGAQLAANMSLGALPVWDDGFAEVCYYDATATIYGKIRRYTRVQIVVREWFDNESGVKTDKIDSPTAVPVLKLNLAEAIPTENYDYRLMTTLLVERASLVPRKLAASSQEWCGLTYRHLRWDADALQYRSFSYFEGEAEQTWSLAADVRPFESLLLIARDAVAGAPHANIAKLLPPLRLNRQVAPDLGPATVKTAAAASELRVPAGTFETRKVTVDHAGKTYTLWIESAAPCRIIKYDFGDHAGELRFAEHRAYWDRNWPSGFYKPNAAP